MIKFAARAGAIDEEKVVLESLGAIKRAGADLIFSYFALDLAEKRSSVKPAPPRWRCAYRGPQSHPHVGRVRRSRHPAQKRLPTRCHCPAALALARAYPLPGPAGLSRM